jgi:hypothetical protein
MKYFRRLISYIFPTFLLKNSRTVKYAFSFLFLFAAVLGMAAVSSKNSSAVQLNVSQQIVTEGSVFSVDVLVYANVPVNAVDLAVVFPTNTVEVIGIDKGESVITLWTEEPRVEGETVFMRGGTYKKGFVGQHKIATINVRAKSTGTALFAASEVKLLAGDGKGTNVVADISGAKVETEILAVGADTERAIIGDVSVVQVTDLDNDGSVTLVDISSFMANWSSKSVRYDFNNDGAMTIRDFSILLAEYFSR